MSEIERPIYMVARGDVWMATRDIEDIPGDPSLCFGTLESAQEFIGIMAEQYGHLPASYRIVRYDFSGDVSEGKK